MILFPKYITYFHQKKKIVKGFCSSEVETLWFLNKTIYEILFLLKNLSRFSKIIKRVLYSRSQNVTVF
jgi:RAB protein geranylgeranyltransferase component A